MIAIDAFRTLKSSGFDLDVASQIISKLDDEEKSLLKVYILKYIDYISSGLKEKELLLEDVVNKKLAIVDKYKDSFQTFIDFNFYQSFIELESIVISNKKQNISYFTEVIKLINNPVMGCLIS